MAHVDHGLSPGRESGRVEPVLDAGGLKRSTLSSNLTSALANDLPRTLRRPPEPREPLPAAEGVVGVVTDFQVPMHRLVRFFLKAVIAAIPAMLLLIAILIGIGEGLEYLFPELVKLKVLIYAPPG
jgi:hypothetical protein